jgi:hypothetical protein
VNECINESLSPFLVCHLPIPVHCSTHKLWLMVSQASPGAYSQILHVLIWRLWFYLLGMPLPHRRVTKFTWLISLYTTSCPSGTSLSVFCLLRQHCLYFYIKFRLDIHTVYLTTYSHCYTAICFSPQGDILREY